LVLKFENSMMNFEKAQGEALRMQEKIKSKKAGDYSVAEEEVNAENVEKIEMLKLGSIAKAELVLISLGLKKSTELTLMKNNESREQVEKILAETGLVCRQKDEKKDLQKNAISTLAIARSEDVLDKLEGVEAYADHVEYGRLMSFPESAVKAFGNKELLLDDADYPSMKGIISGLEFKLSKDNYRKEMELLHEWSDAIKKYAPDTYDRLTGNDFDVSKSMQKYLAEYMEIDIQDAEKIKFIEADSLSEYSEYYNEQYRYLKDNRLENVKIGIVPDNLWKKGKQPTESLADDFLILAKESYFNKTDNPDRIAWMLHELAHCKYFYKVGSSEEYEDDREKLAFTDIETETYPNNIIEKYTFTEQFKFLKEQGKTRDQVVEMLKEYYDVKEDFLFFDKLLDKVY
jgi:hypothetical protein